MHFFFDIAEPLLHTWAVDNVIQYPTLSGFHRAFSLVSSRAFLVDSYHGLSMVAIADACVPVVQIMPISLLTMSFQFQSCRR